MHSFEKITIICLGGNGNSLSRTSEGLACGSAFKLVLDLNNCLFPGLCNNVLFLKHAWKDCHYFRKKNTVIPPEVEEVIMGHPGVVEVCVTGVPHAADGERPAACVVRRAGAALTAQEISDLVASKLSDAKQLRGGVVFVDSLPKTSTGKVIRPRVKTLVMELLARETE